MLLIYKSQLDVTAWWPFWFQVRFRKDDEEEVCCIYMKRYTYVCIYTYIWINIHIMHIFAAWLHCSLDIGDPCPWLHFWQLPRLAPGFWLSWKRAYYGNIIISHIDHTQYMKLSVTQSCTERTWLLTRWLYIISKCPIKFWLIPT